MINGETTKIFGREVSSLPQNIYYKYKDDKENIDKDSTNYYAADIALDALDDNQLKARGYTKVKWMSGFSEDNKKSYRERIRLFSSGLFKEYNRVCDNRYLYPIHSSVIGDYQGVIANSYGY